MSWFKHAPLRQKLTWLTTICSVVALSTTAVSLGVYEWFAYRKTTVSHLVTLSTLTARNSVAALAFANQEDAARILSALDTEPTVVAAAVYDAQQRRFVLYRRANYAGAMPALATSDGFAFDGPMVDITVPVMEAKRFGTLIVRADLSVIRERLAGYGLVLLGTMLVSGVLAWLLTGWITRQIVAPVQVLSAAAAGVRTTADYSIRVPKTEAGELGDLTDAFNDMLARVQQNEVDLYRNNERLRLALESAKIGTWDWNLVRDEVIWNERAYEIFGVPVGTRVDSEVFFSLVHPDDRFRVKQTVEAAANSSNDFSVEFRIMSSEPLAHYGAVRGLFLKSRAGDPLRAVGVMVDITERRAAEMRIIESERRFRAVAERAPVMIWSCDPSLHRDYVNKTWLNFTGRTLEQELGTGWQNGVPAPDAGRWWEVVRTAAAQRDPYQVEYRLLRGDGALRWVFETGSPRLAADGSFAGYLGSCIDITARKENESELEAHVRIRTRELEMANQELESFSYSVSHDLRGPVRAIQGFSEIALEECQAGNTKGAIERIERVMRAAERMNKLIDAFISMARVSRAELRIETVNLSRMADEVMTFLRSTNPERNVTTTIVASLECRGDERLLRIVLENLLGNAWKFTSHQESGRIEFGAMEQGGERVFFVRDNGAGFDAALAHKLFHAFERLHPGTQFEGMGVGLSTVFRVIEKHGGRVRAEGEEGKGATFYFTVPAPVVALARSV
ncbi:MAG: PAS domain S-box protein [Opitutaceae bacterium]|nr:PAS domain S-box protein [Opitutaceae bacterium]